MRYGKTRNNNSLAVSLICIAVGVLILVLYFSEVAKRAEILGFGSGILAVGLLKLVKAIRYSTDEVYRQAVDIETGDERNIRLSTRAMAFSGYTMMILIALCTIVLMLVGKTLTAEILSVVIALFLIIYVASYIVFKAKN